MKMGQRGGKKSRKSKEGKKKAASIVQTLQRKMKELKIKVEIPEMEEESGKKRNVEPRDMAHLEKMGRRKKETKG